MDDTLVEFDMSPQLLVYGMTSCESGWIAHECLIETDTNGYTNCAAKLNLKPVVSIDKNTGYAEATTKINEVATWDLK